MTSAATMSGIMPQGRDRTACRRAFLLVLAICLLLAQLLWFTHQLEHQLHHDRSVCATCLGLAGANAPVAPPPPTATRPPAEAFDHHPCVPGTGRFLLPCYQSRAPPRLPC